MLLKVDCLEPYSDRKLSPILIPLRREALNESEPEGSFCSESHGVTDQEELGICECREILDLAGVEELQGAALG